MGSGMSPSKDARLVEWPADRIERRPISSLIPYARNARTHSPEQVQQLKASMVEFGWTIPVLVDEADVLIAGHGRLMAAAELVAAGRHDFGEAPTMVARGWSKAQIQAYRIADNRLALSAGWDPDMLRIEIGELRDEGYDVDLLGFDDQELTDLFEVGEEGEGGESLGRAGALAEDFGVPPFTVLNAREGWWQDRKRAWLALGIESELGRGEGSANATPGGSQMPAADYSQSKARGDGRGRASREETASLKGGLTYGITPGAYTRAGEDGGATATGTSIFDPVMCELAYRWFCPPGGLVLDPFAGGSVRGIVAAKLGRPYIGVELRAEQIEANRSQADKILGRDDPEARWVEGDSREIATLVDTEADLIFSCPPYYDLELYSQDPRDLSNMPWGDFLDAYRAIIKAAVEQLREDRFAVWVIGDIRDKAGRYRGLPWRTVEAFEAAGARYYNEAVLVTAVGSLPLRVRKQFEGSRKLGKTHQNVLVFCKGNPKKATTAIGAVQFGEVPTDAAADDNA